MERSQFYLSNIDPNAHTLARNAAVGLEIAEFCTAWNLDNAFRETDKGVQEKLGGIQRRILHGPFNELFPCAIDPKARALAAERYRQALSLAARYGANKVVLHGGYNPWLYYPCWYTEQSILFWKEFLNTVPQDMTICLENVLEEEYTMLLDIVKGVSDPRLQMCLDIGHVNAYSRQGVETWLESCAPYLSHFHIHNNFGDKDTHQGLLDGSIDMESFLHQADHLCPNATYTLEIPNGESSVHWLVNHFK